MEPALFYAFAALTCLSAWAAVTSPNIVRMSLFLLLTLGGAAGLYLILGAEFLAAVQLIVYAGGTLILIVFGVMLTSKNPFMSLKAQPWEVAVALLVGIGLAGLMVTAILGTKLGPALPQATEPAYGDVQTLGRALLTTYLVPFEVAAVLLLLVMIGAAYMARRRMSEGR
jgi:NADH:ubiquinone oxidoreductase subunit 6 (subunit J)